MIRGIGRKSLRSGVVRQAYLSRFDLDSQTGAKYSYCSAKNITSFRQSYDRLMTQIQEAETGQEMAGNRFWKFSRSGGNTPKVVPSSQAIRRGPFLARKLPVLPLLRKLESPVRTETKRKSGI